MGEGQEHGNKQIHRLNLHTSQGIGFHFWLEQYLLFMKGCRRSCKSIPQISRLNVVYTSLAIDSCQGIRRLLEPLSCTSTDSHRIFFGLSVRQDDLVRDTHFYLPLFTHYLDISKILVIDPSILYFMHSFSA